MKKMLFVMAMVTCLFMAAGYADATSFTQDNMDPVVFWVIDTGAASPHTVSMSIFSSGAISGYEIQWRTNTSDTWTTLGDYTDAEYSLDLNFGATDRSKLYLQLNPTVSGLDPITEADLTFSDEIVSGQYGSVGIEWAGSSTMDVVLATSCDRVAPVPIPAAMLLFGSGILGLLGLKRRV